MSVEIREILIKTDINSSPSSSGELTPEQLAQLKKELIEQVQHDMNLAQKLKIER